MEQISREKEEAQTLSVKVMYGYNDWVVSTSGIQNSMHNIISRGLYIFYPIFHCGLYCRAVSTIYVKFGLFEKGTKFEKIFHLIHIWHYSVTSNFKWMIFSNFVPFSKRPNFTKQGNSSFWPKICGLQSRAVSNQELVIMARKWYIYWNGVFYEKLQKIFIWVNQLIVKNQSIRVFPEKYLILINSLIFSIWNIKNDFT